MRILALLMTLLLAACQSENPYRTDSVPLPPAPAGVENIVDMSGYPGEPIDMARFRTWQWQVRPVDPELEQAVAGGLDQIGLRPVRGDVAPDLLISAQSGTERRLQQYYDNAGVYYGPGYHHHRHHYGAWGSVPVARTYAVDVRVVRIDFHDGRTGRRLWSASGETRSSDRRSLNSAVNAALTPYPPR